MGEESSHDSGPLHVGRRSWYIIIIFITTITFFFFLAFGVKFWPVISINEAVNIWRLYVFPQPPLGVHIHPVEVKLECSENG